MHGGQRVTLFALRDPGLFELTVSGSGEYSLDLRIAGDVNADGKVDGADSVALDAAAAGADITGDGVVDAGDRQLVAASYGFLANSAPVPADALPDIYHHVGLAAGLPLPEVAPAPPRPRRAYRLLSVEGATPPHHSPR